MTTDAHATRPASRRDYPYYRQAWNRVVLTLLAVSFIPLIVIGGGVYYYAAATLRTHVLDALQMQVVAHQQAIDRFLTEREDDLKLLAELNSQEALLSPGRLKNVFEALQRQVPCFADLGIIDYEGAHRAYVGPYDLLTKNYRGTDWFREVMERGTYVSDVFLGYRQVPHFVIAVRRGSGPDAWILRATVDSDYFNSLVTAKIGDLKVDAFLVNRQGVLQTRPQLGGNLLEPSALRPGEKYEGLRLEETRSHLVLTRWQAKVPWLSVVRVERADIYRVLNRVRLFAIFTFIGGGVIILGAVLLTTGRLVSQLEAKGRRLRVLEEQLRRTNFLSASMEVAFSFFQEIKDILSHIHVSAASLLDKPAGSAASEQNAPIEQIQTQSKRGCALMEKFLHMVRPDEPLIGDVLIDGLLDDLLAFLQGEIERRNIRIIRDYSDAPATVRSDGVGLCQVFQNLLLNAIEAADKNGEIRLSILREASAIRVVISDNGPGIAQGDLCRIFEPLFTTKRNGAGLGLPICRDILHKLGGIIKVASQELTGTSVSVELPMRFTPANSRPADSVPGGKAT